MLWNRAVLKSPDTYPPYNSGNGSIAKIFAYMKKRSP
jgi:hypothetical protein